MSAVTAASSTSTPERGVSAEPGCERLAQRHDADALASPRLLVLQALGHVEAVLPCDTPRQALLTRLAADRERLFRSRLHPLDALSGVRRSRDVFRQQIICSSYVERIADELLECCLQLARLQLSDVPLDDQSSRSRRDEPLLAH